MLSRKYSRKGEGRRSHSSFSIQDWRVRYHIVLVWLWLPTAPVWCTQFYHLSIRNQLPRCPKVYKTSHGAGTACTPITHISTPITHICSHQVISTYKD